MASSFPVARLTWGGIKRGSKVLRSVLLGMHAVEEEPLLHGTSSPAHVTAILLNYTPGGGIEPWFHVTASAPNSAWCELGLNGTRASEKKAMVVHHGSLQASKCASSQFRVGWGYFRSNGALAAKSCSVVA